MVGGEVEFKNVSDFVEQNERYLVLQHENIPSKMLHFWVVLQKVEQEDPINGEYPGESGDIEIEVLIVASSDEGLQWDQRLDGEVEVLQLMWG